MPTCLENLIPVPSSALTTPTSRPTPSSTPLQSSTSPTLVSYTGPSISEGLYQWLIMQRATELWFTEDVVTCFGLFHRHQSFFMSFVQPDFLVWNCWPSVLCKYCHAILWNGAAVWHSIIYSVFTLALKQVFKLVWFTESSFQTALGVFTQLPDLKLI